MKRLFACPSMLWLLAAGSVMAQEQILVDLHDLRPQAVEVKGFSLASDQKIAIKAVGFRSSSRRPPVASAWILNARTRALAWELTESNTQSYGRYFSKFEDDVHLPAGDYAVYYSFFSYYFYEGGHSISGLGEAVGNLVDELFFDGRWDEGERMDRGKTKDLGIVVRGRGQVLDDRQLEAFAKARQDPAFVSMASLWDDDYKKQGFTLDQPLELEIRATGEARYDEEFDYGWIIDTKTREKVWKFDYRDSQRAGGAEKNRLVRATIKLPAGDYAAFWVTDDSHSHRRWNATPPYDPEFWGLTIAVKDAAMKKHVRTFEYEDVPAQNVFLQITRVRDDEFLSEGFSLKKPTGVRIYALGEGREGEMFDYAWIVDAKTRKKVWEMEYYKTEHAGGGEKNRLFDGTLRLAAGNYVAHYVSDGSHSFRDWNTSPPIDQEHWGLTLMTAEEASPAEAIAAYEEKNDTGVIAQITGVRDDQHRQMDFRLTENSDVRIYAVGEGRDGEMFDYGWIEDARSGRVLWEMTYRMTEHAGGGRKNRMLDDTISLKAGEYALHYKSDGSHSSRHWNDSPPHDPAHWGITVYRSGQ
ncbi:MAG: hypothetical protein ACREOO_11350 [bacterium]